MRNILSIILLTTLIHVAYAQKGKPIITQTENDYWIDSLESSSIAMQIDMIKTRIIQDTAVYYPGMTVPIGILRDKIIHIPQNFVAGLNYSDLALDTFQIYGFKGDGRLLIACRMTKNKNIFDFIQIKRDTSVKISTIRKISAILSVDNVAGIEIIRNTDERFALFGSSYGFGVIFIDLADTRVYRQIEKLYK